MAPLTACGTAAAEELDADRGADLRRPRVRARRDTAWRTEVCGLRRVMEDVGEERMEEDLPCREALDQTHGAATASTRPR